MAANALGIDVGEVYRTVEAVKASRAARELENRKYQNALSTQAAVSKAVEGGAQDPASMAALVALNPEAAKTLTETYKAMDERSRATERDRLDKIGTVAGGILQAEDPAKTYEAVRSSDPELAKLMPPEFSADWVKVQLARATETDKLYDAIDGDRVAQRDQQNKLVLQDDAQAATASEGDKNRANNLAIKADEKQFKINQDATAFKNDLVKIEAKAKAEGLGKNQIEAKDTAPIYKMALELLGGVFDVNGNLQVTDPELPSKAQAIAARASKLWLEGAESHAAAVQAAAKELGVNQPAAAPEAPADPFAGGADPLNILAK